MSAPYYSDDAVTLWHGDCLDVLRELPDASVDAVVTDPPYGIGFMGHAWDQPGEYAATRGNGVRQPAHPRDRAAGRTSTAATAGSYDLSATANRRFQAWCEVWTTECLRVLKPGGHVLVFGGARTWHRLACAVEDSGFEVRDSIAWLYSSGFPKSRNVSRDLAAVRCQCTVRDWGHAGAETEHHLPGVLGGHVSAPEGVARGARAVLLAGLPEQGSPAAGWSESAGGEVGAEEPGLEGWGDVQAAEGELHRPEVRALPSGSAADGAGGRVRDGAPSRDGAQDRTTTPALGGGEPHEPQPPGQPAGEPGAVPLERGPQAGRGWSLCGRCGKPSVPDGLGTALKPAFEPIVVGRKPLAGTVAANVLAHGTGALNIDGCRVGEGERASTRGSGVVVSQNASMSGPNYGRMPGPVVAGRWPPNVVLDESQAAELDQQTGTSTSRVGRPRGAASGAGWGMTATGTEYDDSGGPSRFFPTFRYEAKAPTSERPRAGGIAHPTVKPLDLMRWLVRLVTPPGGTVLEPFAGSGTTAEACVLEGLRCIAIEREADYLPLIVRRITKPLQPGFDLGAPA